MNHSFSTAEGRPPGEMPSIDPDSIETDETFAAIISRSDTGKLTVARRENRGSTGTVEPEPPPAGRPGPPKRGD